MKQIYTIKIALLSHCAIDILVTSDRRKKKNTHNQQHLMHIIYLPGILHKVNAFMMIILFYLFN